MGVEVEEGVEEGIRDNTTQYKNEHISQVIYKNLSVSDPKKSVIVAFSFGTFILHQKMEGLLNFSFCLQLFKIFFGEKIKV